MQFGRRSVRGTGARSGGARHQLDPPFGVGAGQREHDRRGGGVGLHVGVAVGDRGDLACFLVVELVEAAGPSPRCRAAAGAAGRSENSWPLRFVLGRAGGGRVSRGGWCGRPRRSRGRAACRPPGVWRAAPSRARGGDQRGPASTLPGGRAAARRARSTGRRAESRTGLVGEAQLLTRRGPCRERPRPSPRPSPGGPSTGHRRGRPPRGGGCRLGRPGPCG